MKKLIIISLCISVLCACGTMRGLQQQSSDKIHKTIKKNDEIYRLEKEGHSPDVKMKIIDKQHSRIYIPVEYIGKIEKMESIKQIKGIFLLKNDDKIFHWQKDKNHQYKNDKNNIDFSKINFSKLYGVECNYCYLNKNHDYIYIYINKDTEDVIDDIYIYEPNISILERFRKMGIIDFSFDVTPKQMKVSCNKKSCAVLDENNQFVNKVIINKNISLNQKKINEIIKKEKEEERKKQIEEKKRQKEEERRIEKARREYEEELWRQHDMRKKECPGLYRIMTYRGNDIDRFEKIKAIQRYVKINCDYWLNDYIRSNFK